jgi:hypothetical protein
MLTARRAFGIGAMIAFATLAAIAPAGYARPRSGPVARAACDGLDCVEQTTLTVPGPGTAETLANKIPSNATQGSINLQPAGPSDQQVFDSLVADLVANNPGLIPPKLNQRSKRILTCVFVSYSLFKIPDDYPDKTGAVVGVQLLQPLLLNACLQLALSFPNPPAAADVARSASGPCARFGAAVTLQITRSRSGYRGVISSKARPPAPRQPATVTCRRSGRGLVLTVRPRVRGQKLAKVIGPVLSIGYMNPTHNAVTVHSTFKVT